MLRIIIHNKHYYQFVTVADSDKMFLVFQILGKKHAAACFAFYKFYKTRGRVFCGFYFPNFANKTRGRVFCIL